MCTDGTEVSFVLEIEGSNVRVDKTRGLCETEGSDDKFIRNNLRQVSKKM